MQRTSGPPAGLIAAQDVAHPAFPMQDRRAADGDTVILDMTPTVDGWLGDFCTSVALRGDDEAAELVESCRWVQQRLVAAVVPGMPARELHALGGHLAAERDLRLLDLLDNIGHSIGREFAADGFIDPWNDTPMVPAWTIEPHLGRRGRGAKFEDIVWLDDDGSTTVV